jgi:hypothetical protein
MDEPSYTASEGKRGGEKGRRMKSFGRLLHRLRGETPLETIGEHAGLEAEYLANLEANRLPIDEVMARHILQRGFDLDEQDTGRLILGIQLYDLGLKDNEIRHLVIGVIRKETPPPVRAELKRLSHHYSSDPSSPQSA